MSGGFSVCVVPYHRNEAVEQHRFARAVRIESPQPAKVPDGLFKMRLDDMRSRAVRPTGRLQFSLGAFLLAVTAFSVVMACYSWYRSAAWQVPRLILELDDRPGGVIDLGWRGRPDRDVEAEIRRYGAEATPYLLKSLSDGRLTRPDLIILELGSSKDPRALGPLIAQLRSSNDTLRASAAAALGRLGDRRAVSALLGCLRERSPSFVRAVVTALGDIGDHAAVPQIVCVLEDNGNYIRGYAAEALGRLADRSAVEALLKSLRCDRELWVRRAAAVALGRIGDPGASPGLTQACHDISPEVRAAAADALRKVGIHDAANR
jgi:hypothetical protein